jgi:hypothetical protein
MTSQHVQMTNIINNKFKKYLANIIPLIKNTCVFEPSIIYKKFDKNGKYRDDRKSDMLYPLYIKSFEKLKSFNIKYGGHIIHSVNLESKFMLKNLKLIIIIFI